MSAVDYQTKTRRILKDCRAFHDGGHYVYTSGLHGDHYVNKDALYAHPLRLDDVGVMLTDCALKSFGAVFDVVVAPATSGIALGQLVAYNLSLDRREEVLFAFSDRNPQQPASRVLRRGFRELIRNRRVLLVDDIVTTGQTLAGLAQAVTGAGGCVTGAVALCDRGSVRVLRYLADNTGVATELTIAALVELDLKTFAPDKCPFCRAGRPIDTNLGEGVMDDLFIKRLNTPAPSEAVA